MKNNSDKLIIGALEQCDLPELHINALNILTYVTYYTLTVVLLETTSV